MTGERPHLPDTFSCVHLHLLVILLLQKDKGNIKENEKWNQNIFHVSVLSRVRAEVHSVLLCATARACVVMFQLLEERVCQILLKATLFGFFRAMLPLFNFSVISTTDMLLKEVNEYKMRRSMKDAFHHNQGALDFLFHFIALGHLREVKHWKEPAMMSGFEMCHSSFHASFTKNNTNRHFCKWPRCCFVITKPDCEQSHWGTIEIC